jgi:hypothetical protein
MNDSAMSTPIRVQYSRTRGSRKPHGAILVAGPSRWRNPFLVGEDGTSNRERAVAEFRTALEAGSLEVTIEDVRSQLRGRDLGCWCPLDRPCHADVLLEVANSQVDALA